MIDPLDSLDNLATFFERMNDDTYLMLQKLCSLDQKNPLKLNFSGCHIAISPNGGLIGICKKRNFLDIEKNSQINSKVIIMHQNAKTRYHIPICWNTQKRWVVCLDFYINEKLYAICNDGTIYKFDTLRLRHKEILTSKILQEEGVEKAKFFEKGFIALTCQGSFYLIKDMKNIVANLLFPMAILEFSNNVDFVAIPSKISKSGRVELFITNEGGNGIVHVEQQTEGGNFGLIPDSSGKGMEIIGVSIINLGGKEKYIKIQGKKNNGANIGEYPMGLGKISALALSPSKRKLAVYNGEHNTVFTLNTSLEGTIKPIQITWEMENYTDVENNEIKAVLSYKNREGYQFLFCGENMIAISGQRFIILSDRNYSGFAYKIKEGGEMDAIQGVLFSKCIPEIDGIRFITNEGVFFVSKVNQDLFDVCYPFSDSNSRNLMTIYQNFLDQRQTADQTMRTLAPVLPETIQSLQLASANIFWTEELNEEFRKELQVYILQGAQYGKNFVQNGDDFNFPKYVEICKETRIINNLRNEPEHPIFITFSEYEELDTKQLIKKLIVTQNFFIANEICKYLGYDIKKVYQNYAKTIIKIFHGDKDAQKKKYFQLTDLLKDIPNISYIKLAKKAFKYNLETLGLKFLEHEKSVLITIPQYIEQRKWDKAFELALQTHDSNVLTTVLDKMLKSEKSEMFFKILDNFPSHRSKVMIYLKKNSPDLVREYLNKSKSYEELLYFYLEKFFESETYDERKTFIDKCKKCLKEIDKSNEIKTGGFDYKYYKNYLDQLESSLNFKKDCMEPERNIIHYSEVLPYKKTIYDCYKSGVINEKLSWIEQQNKNFDYSSKKMRLIQFRAYCEMGRADAIENQLRKTSLKKLGLNHMNLAEVYFDYKLYDKAAECLMEVKEPEYFDYKIEMLKYMEKYENALEAIISYKDNERMAIMVNEVLNKKPKLRPLVDELCMKYKVELG